MKDWWIKQAREALDNFVVVSLVEQEGWKRIDAEADTGSRYQLYAVPSQVEIDGGEWLLVVRHPWERMYEKSPGMFTTAEYFQSKWGKPDSRFGETHGGDLYACMKAASLLVPFAFPEPEEYAERIAQ